MNDSIFFNAHHSPIGAFASFTLGFPGAKGGLGLELGKPADQNVFIGLESTTPNLFEALPFYAAGDDDRARYEVDQGEGKALASARLLPFARESVRREFALGTDTWTAGDLTFRVISPVRSIPEPGQASATALRAALVPAVLVEMTVDNTAGRTARRAFFGYQGNDPYSNMRRLDDATGGKIAGVGQGLRTAIVSQDPGVTSALGFTLTDAVAPKIPANTVFGIAGVGALAFAVPAGQKRTVRFAVCFYAGGRVTANIDAHYYYTRYFAGIEAVAAYALGNFAALKREALKADRLLEDCHPVLSPRWTLKPTAPTPGPSGGRESEAAPLLGGLAPTRVVSRRGRGGSVVGAAQTKILSADQRFMLAHAIRSYYGSTQLLAWRGKPFWVVNEGEYRMMNTFDLTVDHLFYELRLNPWVVRNALDMFADRYRYRDQCGISFTHDMGVANVLSRPGYSSYELFGLAGCFSHMTHEQLVNWVLCAAAYAHRSRNKAWLKRRMSIFRACLASLVNRDAVDPAHRDGIMGVDSSRCMGGAEITTYDSLDVSLGQARNNLYLGVKTWAAYVALEGLLEGERPRDPRRTTESGSRGRSPSKLAGDQAERAAATIAGNLTAAGYIPAVFEQGNESKIIPAIEGLVFPWLLGDRAALDPAGRFGALIAALKRHLSTVLVPGGCLFPDGAWKMSSTSDNSWLSKTYLCQFVCREILGFPSDAAGRRADAAHAAWLTDPRNAYWGWSDQIVAGQAKGSKYYPRGVTAILWLEEGKTLR